MKLYIMVFDQRIVLEFTKTQMNDYIIWISIFLFSIMVFVSICTYIFFLSVLITIFSNLSGGFADLIFQSPLDKRNELILLSVKWELLNF